MGGIATPRRRAAAMRCHRPRIWCDAGRNERSKVWLVRSTVPTIESSGMTCSPRSVSLTRPSAATTSSNGSMTEVSSGWKRSRAAIRAIARRRHSRSKSISASASGKPVSGGVMRAAAGGRGSDQREDALEPGDAQRAPRAALGRNDPQRPAVGLGALEGRHEQLQARRVQELEPAQVELDDLVRRDLGVERLAEPARGRQVELAADPQDDLVVVLADVDPEA